MARFTMSIYRSILVLLVLGVTTDAWAQEGTVLTGKVTSATTGAPLQGVNVIAEGQGKIALTDHLGVYRLTGLSTGSLTIRTERIGLETREWEVTLRPGTTQLDLELTEVALGLDDIVVSVDREARRRTETPATINVLAGEAIRSSHASHPSEVMAQIPGAWVNVTGGEGHMTAIRHPQTTAPVYLYLEDGVPTRSTGFFNHNALYEINLPQSDRIEVVKGPATALYGSDAIGATINVGTSAPTAEPSLDLSIESGAYGWARALFTASGTTGQNGLRADLNYTRTDGWREGTAYDRLSGTLRWDRSLGTATSLKTVATASLIDQATAGSSALSREDYHDQPKLNYTPISYREVRAIRLSTEFNHLRPNSLITLTAFIRDNEMEMIPNWSLTYDPTRYTNGHSSLGVMAKYRRDLDLLRTRVITGIDIDRSPGQHYEEKILPTRIGRVFTDFELGETIYDYDVTFFGLSPYLQLEAEPLEGLHLTAGLRYDHLAYDYETLLAPVDSGTHRRPPTSKVDYSHLSPKFGLAYELRTELNLFLSYGHGFRAPSEGQLFRQGRAVNTLGLSPVRVDSYEGGIRGRLGDRLRYELSVYEMSKHDDILSYTHPDGSQETVNAGRTLHRGVELGAGIALPSALHLDLAYAHSRHSYESWRPRDGVEFDGHEIEQAPRNVGSVVLSFQPTSPNMFRGALELRRVGSYWMDPENTTRYEGHTLATLRAELPLYQGVSLFGRLTNITNTRYAELASYTIARGAEFAPGMPRSLYIGLGYEMGGGQ